MMVAVVVVFLSSLIFFSPVFFLCFLPVVFSFFFSSSLSILSCFLLFIFFGLHTLLPIFVLSLPLYL